MKTLRLLPLLALFAVCGCTDTVQPQMDEIPLFAMNSAAKVQVAFTMEVANAGGIYIKDLGQSGRVMVRDYELFFDVAGDLEGTAEMVLNANFDEASWLGTGLGRASVFGDLSILTGAGNWEGSFTGEFIFDPALSDWNAQLFSKINLKGPNGQKIKADCDETSAESEILACVGEVLNPHG